MIEAPTGLTDLETSFFYLRCAHSLDRNSMGTKLLSSLDTVALSWLEDEKWIALMMKNG